MAVPPATIADLPLSDFTRFPNAILIDIIAILINALGTRHSSICLHIIISNPTGSHHIARCIKIIPFSVNAFPIIRCVTAICMLVPPTSIVFLPLCCCLARNPYAIFIDIILILINPLRTCHRSIFLNIVSTDPLTCKHNSILIKVIPVLIDFSPAF